MSDLQKLFISELSRVYDVEHQLVEALPKMAKAAKFDGLKEAFEKHLEQTRTHIQRVEEVFRSVGQKPSRTGCDAMEALIDEAELTLKQFEDNNALDAALISAGQKAEHLEIAAYGSLCAWAKELDFNNAAELLSENLSEEKETDQILTELAESGQNAAAVGSDTPVKGKAASTVKKMFS